MAQKLVAKTTAPNRKPMTRPPSARISGPFWAIASRSMSMSSRPRAWSCPPAPACIDDYAQACLQPGEPMRQCRSYSCLQDLRVWMCIPAMDTTIRTPPGTNRPEPAVCAAFVHLKVHSAYSLLEGAITIPRLAKLAAAQGFPAVGLTRHQQPLRRARVLRQARRGRHPADRRLHAAGRFRRPPDGQWSAAPRRQSAALAAGRCDRALCLRRRRLAEPHEARLVRLSSIRPRTSRRTSRSSGWRPTAAA